MVTRYNWVFTLWRAKVLTNYFLENCFCKQLPWVSILISTKLFVGNCSQNNNVQLKLTKELRKIWCPFEGSLNFPWQTFVNIKTLIMDYNPGTVLV